MSDTKKTKAEQNEAAIAKMKGEFAALAADAKLDGEEVKIDGRSVFEGNMPEGVTPKIVQDLANHVTNTSVAAHDVIGDIAIDAMVKDKSLDRVVGRVSLGPIGNHTSYISREHTGRNPKDGSETKTVGANRFSLDIFAPGGQRVNTVRDAIKVLAAEKLK